jgi:hypothetical protein
MSPASSKGCAGNYGIEPLSRMTEHAVASVRRTDPPHELNVKASVVQQIAEFSSIKVVIVYTSVVKTLFKRIVTNASHRLTLFVN